MQQVSYLPTLPSLLLEKHTPLIHRDASWLTFNERVLGESRQTSNPLLERAKFLSITATNADEFYMIRFSGLAKAIAQEGKHDDHSKVNAIKRMRTNILETIYKFGARQVEAFDLLAGELGAQKIDLVQAPKPTERSFEVGQKLFVEKILPFLTPHEPFSPGKIHGLDNLQLGIIAATSKGLFWSKVPRSVPTTFVLSQNDEHFIFFLDDLLLSHFSSALSEYQCQEPAIVRLVRDADINVDIDHEDTENIPDQIRSSLIRREKGRPVFLSWTGKLDQTVLKGIEKSLRMEPGQIMAVQHPLCLGGLWSAVAQFPESVKFDPKLSYTPLKPTVPLPFQNPSTLFTALQDRDYLLHHPYDSFDAFVIWMKTACDDEHVTQVEITVYRMDALSPLVDSLKSAAKRGKVVRVFLELRARFDELNNLKIAEDLRHHGVIVGFGFGKLKLHAKIALVTREVKTETGTQTVRYTHLSTGNYKASTARAYTDLAILTSRKEFGEDARRFFDGILQEEVPAGFTTLVTAPGKLHRRVLAFIDQEIKAAQAGKPAHIFAKVNALVDEGVIEKLYRASQAGVKIDLVVRGACSLIPGVKGLSDHIRVISVIDRFLEHSRIYYFASSKKLYLSSADWMQRNFFSRLEIAFPVLDAGIYQYIEQVVIPTYIRDSVKAKELTPQGMWKKRARPKDPTQDPIRSQFYFEQLAASGYVGTPLEKRELIRHL